MPSVFYGAPMLLGSRRDLHDVRSYSVCIGAVHAVDPLNSVQKAKPAAVKNDVISAPNLGDSEDRKANGLVERNEEVEQQEWE
jgi:hypothetical protein